MQQRWLSRSSHLNPVCHHCLPNLIDHNYVETKSYLTKSARFFRHEKRTRVHIDLLRLACRLIIPAITIFFVRGGVTNALFLQFLNILTFGSNGAVVNAIFPFAFHILYRPTYSRPILFYFWVFKYPRTCRGTFRNLLTWTYWTVWLFILLDRAHGPYERMACPDIPVWNLTNAVFLFY